jgi:7-carboxy-7-deazaguanine synthase
MFGLNEKVGKQYFENAPDGKLFVTSIFYTLQGEGPLRGRPAIFVRLAKCNLGCSWCDAFFEDGDWLTEREILERSEREIEAFYASRDMEIPAWMSGDVKNAAFIVTGGEPTLQKIRGLLELAEKSYRWTQIESNGVLAADVPDSTIVVISPKCMEKVDVSQGFKRYVPTQYMKPNKDAIARANVLKFVMEKQPDFDSPYQTVPEWAHEWHQATGRDIFVSPMNIYKREPIKAQQIRAGGNKASLEERSMYDEVVSWWEPELFDMEANQRNHEWAAEYAMRHGFIFQMQLHLFASLA